MYLLPRGIYRVRWDPLPPSGDRHFSIGAFTHFGADGDTLKSLLSPKDRCKRPKTGQPHDANTWESGGTVGHTNSYHSLQGDILICMGVFWRGHMEIFDYFRDISSRKWTPNHSKRIETGPNDPVPCSNVQRASFRSKTFLVNFDFFRDIPTCSVL